MCSQQTSLLLIVVYILSINCTGKRDFWKKKKEIIPIWLTSANDDRWPQDLLMWHLYLAGDLPPTSLSTLQQYTTLVFQPLAACPLSYVAYMDAALLSCQLQFNARGRESVRYLGPHPSHIAPPPLLSNICQSLTVIGNPMYWNTMET